MRLTSWYCRAGGLSLLAGLLLAGSAARAQDGPPPDGPPPGDRPERRAPRDLPRREPPKYWLGMGVAPVAPPLDAQLNLKGEGVLVEDVGPQGPAAKAGLQRNDVIVAVGDKPLKGPRELMDAVNESEGKELTLKVIRAGQPTTVTVTPEKPEPGSLSPRLPRIGDVDLDREVGELERKIREKLRDAGIDMRMQFVRPGRMLPPGADFMLDTRIEFPEDLSITIQKQGKEPAQIEVKRGDQSWKIKDTELAQLPDEVRKYVEEFLGQNPVRFRLLHPPGPPGGPDGPPPPGRPRRPDGPHGPEGPDGPGGPDGPRFGPPPGGPDGPPPGPRERRGRGGPPPLEDEAGDGPRGPRPPRAPGDPDEGPGRRERRGPDGPGPRERERRGPDGPGSREERLERRLEEMSRRLQEMREQIDALRNAPRE